MALKAIVACVYLVHACDQSAGFSITLYWTGELLFWTGEGNWVPKGWFLGGRESGWVCPSENFEILESQSCILMNYESIY